MLKTPTDPNNVRSNHAKMSLDQLRAQLTIQLDKLGSLNDTHGAIPELNRQLVFGDPFEDFGSGDTPSMLEALGRGRPTPVSTLFCLSLLYLNSHRRSLCYKASSRRLQNARSPRSADARPMSRPRNPDLSNISHHLISRYGLSSLRHSSTTMDPLVICGTSTRKNRTTPPPPATLPYSASCKQFMISSNRRPSTS